MIKPPGLFSWWECTLVGSMSFRSCIWTGSGSVGALGVSKLTQVLRQDDIKHGMRTYNLVYCTTATVPLW